MMADNKNAPTSYLITPDKDPEEKPEDPTEEYRLKLIEQCFDTTNVEVKTDLTPNQINAIARAQLFAQRYNVQLVRDLCERVMVLSISKNRKSRDEFIKVSQALTPGIPELDRGKPGIMDRLMGRE